uniref:Uncharacterized protein n=1 Tax=Oryza punctata TaxID=4537 RepID=A0A0E0MEW1_ORYPU
MSSSPPPTALVPHAEPRYPFTGEPSSYSASISESIPAMPRYGSSVWRSSSHEGNGGLKINQLEEV